MTENDNAAEMRDLIHQLTHVHKYAVYQHGELLHYRDDAPLLDILRDARTANIGQGTGGKAAHERITLNISASELYASIHRHIRIWARAADVQGHWALTGDALEVWTDPTRLLRAWHVRVLGDARFDQTPHNDTLTRWVRAITDLCIDPPRRWTLTATCPTCNHRYANDGLDRIDALLITERDPITTSDTTCRNCLTTWPGIDGARHLAGLITDNEQQPGQAA